MSTEHFWTFSQISCVNSEHLEWPPRSPVRNWTQHEQRRARHIALQPQQPTAITTSSCFVLTVALEHWDQNVNATGNETVKYMTPRKDKKLPNQKTKNKLHTHNVCQDRATE